MDVVLETVGAGAEQSRQQLLAGPPRLLKSDKTGHVGDREDVAQTGAKLQGVLLARSARTRSPANALAVAPTR